MTRCHLWISLWVGGCLSPPLDRSYEVDDLRILGIRGHPAEAMPQEPVAYEALVASPEGAVDADIGWSYCVRARSVEERTAVTASCLEGDDLVDIDAETTVLSDACARFGPNPPPADGDAPALRPADPDPTGGYFLPVRAEVNGVEAFGAQRIRCDLAGATREVFEAFQMDYEANRHPEIVAFTPDRSVSVDEVVDLVVQVSPDSEEAYVVYVPEASTLQEATEELTASWYMTSGTLSRGSEILGGGAATTRWTAPKAPGPVYGWVVVRDSRGGMAWEGFTVEVEPSG